MHTQYFDLQNRAIGTYGYEWIDFDPDSEKTGRHLKLSVAKYANGNIDPTFLNVGVKEQDVGMVL